MGELEPMDRLISLARLAHGGHSEALERLLEQSVGLAHAIARARLGETMAAESAAIDALARVAQSLPRLQDCQAYPHWLYRIAVRCVADARVASPPVGAADRPRGHGPRTRGDARGV